MRIRVEHFWLKRFLRQTLVSEYYGSIAWTVNYRLNTEDRALRTEFREPTLYWLLDEVYGRNFMLCEVIVAHNF